MSEVAARQLKFHSKGIGNVKVEVLEPGAALASAAGFNFEVSGTSNFALATNDMAELALSSN